MKLWSLKSIKYFICVLAPFALSPLAFSPYKESRCTFVILWMAIYWVLEPVDLTVTALMPVPLMPLLGILSGNEVASNYMSEVLMMFIGGLGVAVAVEYCNLHERVALKVLMTLGTDRRWLMLGFMLTTMFLSMWISNTATTAMMVPIIEAVMAELQEDAASGELLDNQLLHKTLLLSVAYAANCGGTGTITGTSPNMIFKGIIEQSYPGSSEITYASWMGYNIPGMLLCVISGWLILQLVHFSCSVKQDEEVKNKIMKVISSRYRDLGNITFHEGAILSLFILLVFLWTFRQPKFMPGWVDLINSDKQIGDAAPAIGVLCLMFLLPAEPWHPMKSPPLLTWNVVQQKMRWGLVLLLGGGYAIADGAKKSGLSEWIGDQTSQMTFLSPVAVLIIICLTGTMLTEIMSNSTVTSILLPVINQMAVEFRINPLYFMLPLTVVASYAFMLPVATGPNAIVFGTGKLRTIDMVKPGILMNIVACAIQLLMINTLGYHMFNLDKYPSWINETNATGTRPS